MRLHSTFSTFQCVALVDTSRILFFMFLGQIFIGSAARNHVCVYVYELVLQLGINRVSVVFPVVQARSAGDGASARLGSVCMVLRGVPGRLLWCFSVVSSALAEVCVWLRFRSFSCCSECSLSSSSRPFEPW